MSPRLARLARVERTRPEAQALGVLLHRVRQPADDPAQGEHRLADTAVFFAPETSSGARSAVLDKYGVSWLVLDKHRNSPAVLERVSANLEPVYEDGRFVLLRTRAT